VVLVKGLPRSHINYICVLPLRPAIYLVPSSVVSHIHLGCKRLSNFHWTYVGIILGLAIHENFEAFQLRFNLFSRIFMA
jgi:hypothetical protein